MAFQFAWKFLGESRGAPPGPGGTMWCLWYSQSLSAVQVRLEGGQIPLFQNVFCPDNCVPQKGELGTGTQKVATSPCLEQFIEEGIEIVWWESWSWLMTVLD